jgi:hypothetical protein
LIGVYNVFMCVYMCCAAMPSGQWGQWGEGRRLCAGSTGTAGREREGKGRDVRGLVERVGWGSFMRWWAVLWWGCGNRWVVFDSGGRVRLHRTGEREGEWVQVQVHVCICWAVERPYYT